MSSSLDLELPWLLNASLLSVLQAFGHEEERPCEMLWRGHHQEEEAAREAEGREEADEARWVCGHSPRSLP